MSQLAATSSVSRLRDFVIAGGLMLLALGILYAVFVDQTNVLHELAHDGRHLFAVPCH